MIVYVAGSSEEKPRARAAMDALCAAGFTVALDWVAVIKADGGRANEGHTYERRTAIANQAWNAVRHADALWLLAPETRSAGCWAELMAAYTSGARVVVSGNAQQSVFCALADAEVDTDEQALAWLVERRAER